MPRLTLACFHAAACGLLLSVAARGQVLVYDFGTEQSVTYPGSTKVTPKDVFSAERGYGFDSADGLQAFDRGGWKKEAKKGSRRGPQRSTSRMTADLIEGVRENAFSAAMPDGDYTVWLIACDASWTPPLFDVHSAGRKQLDVRIPRNLFVYMEPFETRAAGGRLRVEFKGAHGWIASGLVIGKPGRDLDKVVAALEQESFFETPEDAGKWKEVPHKPRHEPPVLTAAERAQGYVTFVRDCTDPAYPASVPARAEIGAPIKTFATPGEFEPGSFCVYPGKALGAVAVELTDFAGEDGRRISRENVKVGIVRCWPQRGGRDDTYQVIPELIDPPQGRACVVKAGETKQWWLTVHVPEDAAAGRYRATVTVRPQHAPAASFEWRLLVLPFTLARPADKHWGIWPGTYPPLRGLSGPERRGRNTPDEIDRVARAEMKDLVEHGFDTVLFTLYFGVKENPDGSFTFGSSKFETALEYFRLLGPSAQVVCLIEYPCRMLEEKYAEKDKEHVPGTFSPKARRAVVALVRHVQEVTRKQGWPNVLYYPIDEPGNSKTKNRYLFAENVLDLVHEVPGCKTATTITAGGVQRLGERVDVRIYAYGHFNRDKVVRDAEQGHPFWYYNNGIMYGHSTRSSRTYTGFEFLRSGATTATGWGFAAYDANPYNDFDGGHKDWNVLLPGVDTPTPTLYWEMCREGVDDCRYVATLQQRIREAKASGQAAAAAQAEQVLAPILDPAAPGIRDPRLFGRYRWRIAREILRLAGAQEYALPFPPTAARASAQDTLGPNLVANPSFEDGPGKNGLPGGLYSISDKYSESAGEPSGALAVTEEEAHSGRYALKWDFARAHGKGVTYGERQWLVVNVKFADDVVRALRGKRVKVGMWVRLGGGFQLPGMRLRQFGGGKYLAGIAYGGGLEDQAVWNRFEAEGRIRDDVEGIDIHLACRVPSEEAAAKASSFYIDDVYLHAYDEPPLSVTTPLEEYHAGERIDWRVAAPGGGAVTVVLGGNGKVCAREEARVNGDGVSGTFDTAGLKPGLYRVQATLAPGAGGKPIDASEGIVLAPDPFAW
ncbi:MAG: hypothetical protein JXR37_34220 [Kiritimatiellae bacterium]|nr:hypothetical protein [Kiritimatiellia bacterium]